MKLLFVIDSLTSGGAQRQLTALACGLAARGHAVHLFVYYERLHFAPTLEAAGVTLHVRPAARLGRIRALRSIIQAQQFAAVISFLNEPNLYAELTCLTLPSQPLIVSERGPHPPNSSQTVKLVMRQLHRRAGAVVTNAHAIRETIATESPWLRGKLHTVYNGLDLDQFAPRPMPPADPFKILAVGGIAPYKNIPVLLNALAHLKQRGQLNNIHVSWYGRVCAQPMCTEAKAAADALIVQHQLEDVWAWGGVATDMAPIYADHHVLVHPSFIEGLSNVICEAFASTRPVIASRILEHPRLIGMGQRGLLFDPNDSAELADAIEQMRSLDADELAAIGRRGRAWAEQALAVDRMVDAWEALIQGVAG